MESIDIVTAVKEHPEHRNTLVSWRGKVQSVEEGIVTFHIRRKIFAETHLDYMVRVPLPSNETALAEGDRVVIEGTIPGIIYEQKDLGSIFYYIDLDEPQIQVIDQSGRVAQAAEEKKIEQ